MDRPINRIANLYATVMIPVWSSQPVVLRKHEKALINHYCPNEDVHILNVGCGAGRETFALYEKGYRNVTGIDLTPELLVLAPRQAEELQLPIEFYLGSVAELPFPDESFDVVTVFENIYGHITPRANRIQSLREIRRCLKGDGRALIDANSLLNHTRYHVPILMMEAVRRFFNPFRLERGDKLMRGSRPVGAILPAHTPRSHWFRPGEGEAESAEAGIEVVLSSTVRGVLEDPSGLRHDSATPDTSNTCSGKAITGDAEGRRTCS
jgi:SAM-dependent methyltransferase